MGLNTIEVRRKRMRLLKLHQRTMAARNIEGKGNPHVSKLFSLSLVFDIDARGFIIQSDPFSVRYCLASRLAEPDGSFSFQTHQLRLVFRDRVCLRRQILP
jgi:hypothetical protein